MLMITIAQQLNRMAFICLLRLSIWPRERRYHVLVIMEIYGFYCVVDGLTEHRSGGLHVRNHLANKTLTFAQRAIIGGHNVQVHVVSSRVPTLVCEVPNVLVTGSCYHVHCQGTAMPMLGPVTCMQYQLREDF